MQRKIGLPNGIHDPSFLPAELLGHIKSLDTPALFPPLSSTNASLQLSIPDPLNTLGKLIYLSYPYTLQIRGSLLYYTLTFVQYSVPICSVYWVESPTSIMSRSCLVSVDNS
jgi:hypothetical protein